MLPFLIGADGVVRNGAKHHGSTTPPFAKKRANGTPPNLGGDFFRTSLNVQTPARAKARDCIRTNRGRPHVVAGFSPRSTGCCHCIARRSVGYRLSSNCLGKKEEIGRASGR